MAPAATAPNATNPINVPYTILFIKLSYSDTSFSRYIPQKENPIFIKLQSYDFFSTLTSKNKEFKLTWTKHILKLEMNTFLNEI